jgi:hypothetical protein
MSAQPIYRMRFAHAGELGFRDFPGLSLVKENRRQLGNPACCIPFDEYRRQSMKRFFAGILFKGKEQS